jgi:5-methylcytosine-specific restriction endonuclease McrA
MNIVTEKRCSKCGEVKPRTSFYKDNKRKDKLTPQCSVCMRANFNDRSDESKERKRVHSREYYHLNIESMREKYKEITKRYRDNHKDTHNKKQKERRQNNPERYKEYRDRFYWNNWEKVQAKHKKWVAKNPEKNREYKANRRAKKLQAGGNFTAKEFKELCNSFHNVCLCCGSTDRLVADHVMPISRGGTNSIDNIQPLCFSCNAKKHAKFIDYRPK